ncbi:hypothetical protein KDK95_04470 [Actinospica sp. MGRD01-02]|uniref:Glycosyltransferase RgtA/B/C/D-like domain-containing protein n=1 Tax=Actinospica acidithermotolerans TaxID=2828514 RepID=A0A941EAL6_9ACTN|nr:hypothetical protein [Actinospica acidithermotolerans]MBR7825549.1 hypothetical protein [Actinospica acidithermotolerans]
MESTLGAGTDVVGARTPFAARARKRLRGHAPEIIAYCVVRAVGLVVLAAMASHSGHLVSLLTKWDGSFYLEVARHGYDTALTYRPDGSLVNTDIVFFPLYPFLTGLLGLGLGVTAAALLVSLGSGIVAAVALCGIGEHLYDKRTGVILAALWAAVPTAVVESMAYTESLYTALAALTLLCLLRERWIAAGIAAFFAGLTHPTGIAAALTIGVCLLAALLRGERGGRVWLATAMAPLGMLAYLAWVAVELGRWDGFTYMEERGWGSDPSLAGVWQQIVRSLTHALPLGYEVPVFVLGASLLFALWLTLSRRIRRDGLPVLAFAWISIALALFIGPTYFHAEARFLMPDFPLLLPPAAFLARRNRYTALCALTVCAGLSAWYGGYLLTIWTHSP